MHLPSLAGWGKKSVQLKESCLCPTSSELSTCEHTPKVCPEMKEKQ